MVHDTSERPETARRQTYSRFNVDSKGARGGGGGGEGLLQSQAPAVSRKGKARGMQLRLGACGLNVRGDVLNRADALGSRDDDDNDDDGDGDDKTKKAGEWSPGSVSRTIIYESHYRDAPRPETFSNGARPDDACRSPRSLPSSSQINVPTNFGLPSRPRLDEK